jgi:hypothetical protein
MVAAVNGESAIDTARGGHHPLGQVLARGMPDCSALEDSLAG